MIFLGVFSPGYGAGAADPVFQHLRCCAIQFEIDTASSGAAKNKSALQGFSELSSRQRGPPSTIDSNGKTFEGRNEQITEVFCIEISSFVWHACYGNTGKSVATC